MPKEDDDDTGESELASRGIKQFRDHMDNAADEDDDAVVAVQEPEEEEELDETPQAPSRRDKRAARQSSRERAAAAEAEAKVLREQLESERRRPAPVFAQPAQQQGNPVENIDKEIRRTTAEQKRLFEEYSAKAGKLSASEEQEFHDRALNLEVAKNTLIIDRREALMAPQRQREQRISELKARHPDVFANPAAERYAQAVWNAKMARGEPDVPEAVDAAMEEARQVILGKRPPPDKAARSRATGMGSLGRFVSPQKEVQQIRMPKGSDYDKMARAAYPNLDPAAARQKWANGPGRGILELQRGRQR